MDRELIIRLLEEAGLERYKSALASWIYPTAQLVLEPESDQFIPIGSSKVGGNPDLLPEIEWPMWNDYPMTFIAQIHLAECPAELSLPKDGLISFFYAVQAMFEDDDFYGDPKTCRVLYIGADQFKHLSRRTPPLTLDGEARMRANRVSFVQSLSVPPAESAHLESLGLGWRGNREDFDKYWNLFLPSLRKYCTEDSYIHRILGHPDPIQGDMQVGCEIIDKGYTWESLRKNEELHREVIQSALKWRLLLQMDSEEEKTGMVWGDVGRIYFWIREEDLECMRFDRVICEMQCT